MGYPVLSVSALAMLGFFAGRVDKAFAAHPECQEQLRNCILSCPTDPGSIEYQRCYGRCQDQREICENVEMEELERAPPEPTTKPRVPRPAVKKPPSSAQ